MWLCFGRGYRAGKIKLSGTNASAILNSYKIAFDEFSYENDIPISFLEKLGKSK